MLRLELEPLRPDHAAAMFEGLADPASYIFLPGEPPADVASLRLIYERQVTGCGVDGETWLNWVVRRSCGNALVGYTQATIRAPVALVAYHIFPAHWRRGFGTAALNATLAKLFAMPCIEEVRALIDTGNLASLALVRKLGFSSLRTIIGADHFKGRSSDEHEFAIRQSEWARRVRSDHRDQ